MTMIKIFNVKKVLTTGLIGAALLAMTGCSQDPYSLYKAAEEKTESAKTGVYDVAIELENQFDTSRFTEEQLKAVNYMKRVAYQGKSTMDKEQDAVISDSWLNLGGIGFDFTFYGKGDAQYIKYPVLKKYIDVKQLVASSPTAAGEMPAISKETEDGLAKIWSDLATKDTVKSMEDAIIATDQGDVKAKHLTVKVDGEAVKKALLDSQTLILADPSIQKMLAAQMEKAGEADTSKMYFLTENMTIEDFEISSYVDADGYLVKEEVRIQMGGFADQSAVQGSTFHLETVYSKLDQPVALNFPEIKPEQVFTQEELNLEMPSVFKDLMQ